LKIQQILKIERLESSEDGQVWHISHARSEFGVSFFHYLFVEEPREGTKATKATPAGRYIVWALVLVPPSPTVCACDACKAELPLFKNSA
jgi:hypothetical protein